MKTVVYKVTSAPLTKPQQEGLLEYMFKVGCGNRLHTSKDDVRGTFHTIDPDQYHVIDASGASPYAAKPHIPKNGHSLFLVEVFGHAANGSPEPFISQLRRGITHDYKVPAEQILVRL